MLLLLVEESCSFNGFLLWGKVCKGEREVIWVVTDLWQHSGCERVNGDGYRWSFAVGGKQWRWFLGAALDSQHTSKFGYPTLLQAKTITDFNFARTKNYSILKGWKAFQPKKIKWKNFYKLIYTQNLKLWNRNTLFFLFSLITSIYEKQSKLFSLFP